MGGQGSGDRGFPGYDRLSEPLSRVSQNEKRIPREMEVEVTVKTDRPSFGEMLNYYVVAIGVLEPMPAVEDSSAKVELTCIVLEFGRALENLGLEPVFANTFSAPLVPHANLMSIHGVWEKMSASDKATLRLLSPSLARAIELIAPVPSKTVSVEDNGHPQDKNNSTATVEEGSGQYVAEEDKCWDVDQEK